MAKIQIRINTRQRNILYAILNSGGHISMKEIAEKTGLSARIVRYNMPTVLNWLENEGIRSEAIPGHGYEFEFTRTDAERMQRLLNEESDQVLNLTRDQRLRVELLELLTADKPVSFQVMADNEGISRSTVVMDTSQIEEWLRRYQLTLVRTPNRGTYVTGSELFRRCALIQLIRDEAGMYNYYAVWMHRKDIFSANRSVPRKFSAFLKELELNRCYQYIDFIEKGMGMRLALFSRVEMVLYLAIFLNCLRDGQERKAKELFFDRHAFDVEEGIETEIARALVNRIGRDHGFEIADSERNFMAVMLLFSKWDNEDVILSERKEYPGENSFLISHEAVNCADLITAACANQIHPLLQTDEELVMNLARHFHTVFHQIQYGYPIINEDLPLILKEYPEIFRSVNSEISLIEDQIHSKIPPEEIGYIVMYMVSALNRLQTEKHFRISVVILGDGIRTKSIFLKDRLQLFFPTMEVIAMINGLPEDESILDRADLVISLLPGVRLEKPMIEVSPFLTQNEIRVVQNRIIEFEEQNRASLMTPTRMPDLIDLLHPENIIIGANASGWEDVIRLAAKPLEDQKLIKPAFCDAMIQITREYGPYTTLAPGVVLLNARPKDGVNRLCMSMLLLEHPVEFDASLSVNIAFVLGASDNHSHLNALFQLSKICDQEGFITSLKKCTRSAEVLRAIWIYSSDISLTKLM